MIPFASQRSEGQDLATHLLNAHDNEYVELADLRGSMADDLHGAFAEWEAQASAMTRCRNYLYSLSVNPDPAQGPMPRELYDDYIARAEDALGLAGQPRAVIYHIKEDKRGVPREHCHVVWSRIDMQACKAIHMSFDHDKLMTITRRFARDHGIELAPGYHRLEDRRRQTYRQLSLYEKFQDEQSGVSKEERIELVTELWRHRDDARSFVNALEYHGYVLASGKRPFVLVDIYGHTNSLPKLIDDKAANTKAVRAFLGDEFAEENLPSVEEAKELAASHRTALKDFARSQDQAEQLDHLKHAQQRQRESLDAEVAAVRERHESERANLAHRQLSERSAMTRNYLSDVREIAHRREISRPEGLAGFLARASGLEMIRARIHRYQDAKRYAAYLGERSALREEQRNCRAELERCQKMQMLDLERKRRTMDQSHSREQKSLKESFVRQYRIRACKGYEHMPAWDLALTPRGRPAATHKAMNRYTSQLAAEHRKTAGKPPKREPLNLQHEFQRAADDKRNQSGGGSGRKPEDPDSYKPHTPDRGNGRRR